MICNSDLRSVVNFQKLKRAWRKDSFRIKNWNDIELSDREL